MWPSSFGPIDKKFVHPGLDHAVMKRHVQAARCVSGMFGED